MTQTTPTRDEAVLRIASLIDENAELYSENAMDRAFLGNSEELASLIVDVLALTAPAPASGGVDAVAVDERIDSAWADGARFVVNELDCLIPDSTLARDKLVNIDLRIAQRYADALASRAERRASLSPAATPGGERKLTPKQRVWVELERRAALAKPASSPAGGGVRPEDLQLLDHLKRDNVLGGARPVVSGGEELAQAWRLSEDGLIALEQVARGVRLHITRRGVAALAAALSQSTSAGRVGE